jgi:hypothetical protein
MSDSKGPRLTPTRKPGDAPPPVRPGATGTTGRFERPGGRERPRVAGSRHAAITRTLQNYASYKSWAEKMRINWEPGKDPKA